MRSNKNQNQNQIQKHEQQEKYHVAQQATHARMHDDRFINIALGSRAHKQRTTADNNKTVVYPSPATRATTTLALEMSHAEQRSAPVFVDN